MSTECGNDDGKGRRKIEGLWGRGPAGMVKDKGVGVVRVIWE